MGFVSCPLYSSEHLVEGCQTVCTVYKTLVHICKHVIHKNTNNSGQTVLAHYASIVQSSRVY